MHTIKHKMFNRIYSAQQFCTTILAEKYQQQISADSFSQKGLAHISSTNCSDQNA